MSLPMLHSCCGVSLERGSYILTIISLLACVGNIAAGSRNLPHHRAREPEDNLISMSMVMFSTLSAISNIVILVGIWMRRPGYIQFSMLFNSLFVVFNFLIMVVTCLYSPEFRPFLVYPEHIVLVVVAMVVSAAYCFYFLLIINSLYRKMKMGYCDSEVPV